MKPLGDKLRLVFIYPSDVKCVSGDENNVRAEQHQEAKSNKTTEVISVLELLPTCVNEQYDKADRHQDDQRVFDQ